MCSNMGEVLVLTREEWGTYTVSVGPEPTSSRTFIHMSPSDVWGPSFPDQGPDFSIRDLAGLSILVSNISQEHWDSIKSHMFGSTCKLFL